MTPPHRDAVEHEPRISVLVPVYNVAAFIGECLDSILQQNERNLEVLVVDDGSTDGTVDIVRKYAASDERITLIRQDHAGQAVARNRLLDNARGKWIFFCDGDDMLAPGALSRMLAVAEGNDLDALFFSAEVLYETPDLERRFSEFKERYVFATDLSSPRNGPEFFVARMEAHEWRNSLWLICFRRQLVQEYALRFPVGNIREDDIFTMSIELRSRAVARIADRLYIRRIRDDSVLTGAHAYQDVHGYIENVLEIQKLDETGCFDSRTREQLGRRAARMIRMADKAWEQLSEEDRARLSKEHPVAFAWASLFSRTRTEDEFRRREVAVENLRAGVSRRDASIASLKEAVSRRDASIASLKEDVFRRDASIASLKEAVSRRDALIASLKEGVSRRDASIASLGKRIADQNSRAERLESEAVRTRRKVARLRHELSQSKAALSVKRNEISAIRGSMSFKAGLALTAAPRFVLRILGGKTAKTPAGD